MDFDLAELDTQDTAVLEVLHPVSGQPTGWKITFASKAHQRFIDISNDYIRRSQRESAQRDQARANGRKWKPEEKTPEQVRAENVALVADRILDWTPIKIQGESVPFSRENARRLLADPHKDWLYDQCLQFIAAEENFLPRSETNSWPTPSTSSSSPSATTTASPTETTSKP